MAEIPPVDSTTTTDPNNVRLSDAHLGELAESGISCEVFTAAGVYTEKDPARVGELLNWTGPAKALGPCLVFPYLDANGQPMDYHRLKPTTTRASKKKEDKGKKIKYEGPRGRPNRLYITPRARAALADPSVALIVTEGEKKGLSGDSHGYVCLSIPGVWAWVKKRPKGADGKGTGPKELNDDLKAVAWKGRRVYLIFDSDAALNPNVLAAERALAEVLTAAGAVVVVIRLPAGKNGEKLGLDDYLARHGKDALDALLAAADARPTTPEGGGDGKGPSMADQLVALACSFAELWHDPAQTAFATFGRRTMTVRSKTFRNWLICRYRAASGGKVPSGDALTNASNAIEAQAVIDGPEYEAHVRVAHHSGRVYLHLADADDTVIEVDSNGWRECPESPMRFRRAPGAAALPMPERGGSLDDLRSLINLEDRDQFALIVGFLSGAMFPGQPQPALVANGEQGSGKTTVSRVLKALIDPSAAPVRSEPKEVRDLMIAARNNHLLVLDNMSHMPNWLSDALCRLATGGGFTTRELYTDDGEVIFDARRPVILNGIEDFVTRGDLLERSILLRLPSIPEEKRVPESVFWERFDAMRAKLLGAILTRVAGGLRELPRVQLDRLPRMADFARWCVACERGAGEPPRFLAAYTANQSGAHEQALEGSCVSGVVVSFMTGRENWEGTPSELYRELYQLIATPAPRDWPKAANSLMGRLRRLAPNLRRVHRIDFETDRRTDSNRGRVARLVRTSEVAGKGPSGSSGSSDGHQSQTLSLDDQADDSARKTCRPSDSRANNSGRSDDPDGSDDLFPTAPPMSREQYAEFLDMH